MQQNTPIKTKIFFENALKNTKIPINRQKLLISIANFITSEIKKENTVFLNFICTHNSRRSQFAQIWAHVAIEYYRFQNIASFSGGTCVTAFHRNTVKTLQAVGFHFTVKKFSHTNPVYEILSEVITQPIIGFSKIYDDSFNKKPFIAITTCASAQENCPFIPNTLKQYHLEYVDPKFSDNTSFTAEKYMETNKIIAAEMNFLFNTITKQI